MSSRADLSSVEESLNKILNYSLSAHHDLVYVTLKKTDYETFRQYNSPDSSGHLYFKNVLLKKGIY